MRDITPPEVTPSVGKGDLGTWRARLQPLPDTEPDRSRGMRTVPSPIGKPQWSGVYMSQHLSLLAAGRPWADRPRSEPDSGNPTVRDRREACGDVGIMGVGLRPIGKPMERPPDPTVQRALHFYPDLTRQK